MPRTGGVYSPPAGTKGVPNTTIQSVPYNTLIDDLAADANAARPVTAGGTGATSASGARTALGLEVGSNVQAYDAGLQSIAGLTTSADQVIYTTALDAYATTALTPFARTLIDDSNPSAMLSTLGVSDFMKTVLDDGDAATARSTLGANNASNLTTGTLADARLPTTLAGKNFTGQVTGTSLTMTGAIQTNGGTIVMRSDANKHLWFQGSGGNNRALLYNEVADNSLRLQLHNVAGTYVRSAYFRESDGLFRVEGPIAATGASISGDITVTRGNGTGVIFLGGGNRYLYYNGSKYEMPSAGLALGGNLEVAGGAIYYGDGNVYMPWAGTDLYSVLGTKITAEGRSYPRRVGGSAINFHWSGQGGQPSWLWGGNDGHDMYVYNPSNFSVNYANSAGSAGTLSNWAGWAGTWTGVSRIGGTVYHNTTGRWLPVSASGGNNGIAIYYGPSAETAVHNHYAGFSGGNDFSTFGIVPPGWYYSFNATLSVFEARN